MRRAEGGETGHFLRCFREARAGAQQPRMPLCGNLGHSRRPGHARRKMAQVAVPDFSVRGKPESSQKSHITYTSQRQKRPPRSACKHRRQRWPLVREERIYKSQTKANSTTTAKTARLNHKAGRYKNKFKGKHRITWLGHGLFIRNAGPPLGRCVWRAALEHRAPRVRRKVKPTRQPHT